MTADYYPGNINLKKINEYYENTSAVNSKYYFYCNKAVIVTNHILFFMLGIL
jgi:hypothetical protein